MNVSFDASAILEGTVRKAGNGAHVLIPLKYLGKEVRVVILDE